jgi:hypothetical protein
MGEAIQLAMACGGHAHRLDLNLQDAGLLILELLKDHQSRFSMRQSMIESPSINGADEIALACLSSPH